MTLFLEPYRRRHYPRGDHVTDAADLIATVAPLLKERGAAYGPAADHHGRTAAILNALKGWQLTARDVSEFFEVDKLVRRQTSPQNRDHYADGIGYAGLSYSHALREDDRVA